MGLIKITSSMTEAERIAAYNSNMQYLEKDLPLKHLPVGIIISFDTPVDPNKLYGGTWERIKGKFIWGVDDDETSGVTGGEKTHTLTIDEMPKHRHDLDAVNAGIEQSGGGYHPSWVNDKMYTVTVLSAETGGGQAHNNMPPYYGAYTWRRVA